MIPYFVDKSKLPHRPGVYIFRDGRNRILYVGKAIDLYHRVTSYFNGRPNSLKTAALVERIRGCETIEVFSELEALLLEANLIKKCLPPYNIRLTDDKDYLYIKITKEPFPRVLTARKKEIEDAKYFFGPFPSSNTVRLTLKKLRRIFPWCSAPQSNKPCFFYHLDLCPGACIGKISQKDYNRIIDLFAKFLEGRKQEVVKHLTSVMMRFSQKQEYEKAQRVKKVLAGIEYLTQSNQASVYLENPNFVQDQNLKSLESLKKDLRLPQNPERIECFDISNIQGQFAVGSLVVLTLGEIDRRWYRRFKVRWGKKINDYAMMAEVVRRRLKHKEWPKPDLMLVDGGRGQVRAARLEITNARLEIPVFGLAKRLEWLYSPDEEIIKLHKSSLSLRLLQKIRDEAHRFALSYHRKLRDIVK